jgi:DNA-3-methyladenine glycosylase
MEPDGIGQQGAARQTQQDPEPLPAAFYQRDVLQVAPDLLSMAVNRRLPDGTILTRRITEVEAYRGEDDTACHARAGRTKRTAVMYRPGGVAYVYLCYGIHHLINVVTGPADMPQAALLRGVEGTPGPGRLTKALQIDLALNGASLLGDGDIWLSDAVSSPPAHLSPPGDPGWDTCGLRLDRPVNTGPRIGIGYATPADQARPWRFWTA